MKVTKSGVSLKSDASKKSVKAENDIFEEWRPPPGIKYELSQTNIEFDAKVPRMKVKYTTLDIEPGQDLTIKPSSTRPRYDRPKGRGPVFQFTEEIEEAKAKLYNDGLIDVILKRVKYNKMRAKQTLKAMHDSLIHQIGPPWYHELSRLQMNAADSLKAAMAKDTRFKIISNTQDVLTNLGIVLWPNHTKVEYALNKYHECPVEFLLKLYQLNRPKEPEKQNEYTLNDRIMLSAVVHLSIRDIFRELHLRLPSPPKKDPPPPHKPKRRTKKYPKWNKTMSPYLKPMIPVEQKHRQGVYKNRHKEYPSLQYFNYKDDMYIVTIVDDLEAMGIRKSSASTKKNKWTRPPKIPVRMIESKMKKKKVYTLKKPSEYISPCEIKMTKAEEVVEKDPNEDNVCTCGPEKFTPETAFDLKIKVTTSNEEVFLTQKLNPYKESDNIGNLSFVDQKIICACAKEAEDRHIKTIEYSCECCVCGKEVNISQDDAIEELDNERMFLGGLPTIQEYGGEGEESEPSDIRVCPCITPSSSSSMASDDTYALCTCKSSSDSDFCTCCICDKIDAEFLKKIRLYNIANNTCYAPCTCDCQCKKKKKKRESLCQGPPPVEYCFCKETRKEQYEEEEEEEEEEIPKGEAKIEIEEKKKSVKIDSNDTVEEEEKPCECETLYNNYLNAHQSCLSLFKHYQQKIEDDIKDYMADLNINRCTCGESLSRLEEEDMDDEQMEGIPDGPDCICDCCDKFKGCTCNEFGDCCCFDDNSSSSSEETSEFIDNNAKNTCMCSCTCGPCECGKFVEKVKQNIEDAKEGCKCQEEVPKERSQSIVVSKPEEQKKKEEEDKRKEGEEGEKRKEGEVGVEEEEEEEDPRIYRLDEFPKNRRKQMELLKKVLQDLATEKYPVACFPEVHRLPHFQVWLDLRSGKYISMEDRDTLLKISKLWWTHIEMCSRKCDLPKEGCSKAERRGFTYGKIFSHRKYLLELRTDFWRRLKRANIDQAQEFFPTMFHYKLPNKTFRNVFFSYFPADENHCHVYRIWKKHEMKDMSTRKPCL